MLKKTADHLADELNQKNAILNKSEREIEQRRIKIDHKKNELDMLNKKLEQLIAKAGVCAFFIDNDNDKDNAKGTADDRVVDDNYSDYSNYNKYNN